MFLPSFVVVGVHALSAERALCSTWRLCFLALMVWKLFREKDGLALGTEFVFGHVLAFLKQVLLNLFDLNDLLALPAAGQHRTLLPVMDVQRFLVEGRVLSLAEVAAHAFLNWNRLWLGCLSLALWVCCRFLANVGFDRFFSGRVFLRLFGGHTVAHVYFSKFCHQRIKLGLAQAVVVRCKFIRTHDAIELPHAVVGRKPDVVGTMVDSLLSKLSSSNQLVIAKIEVCEQLVQKLELGDFLLVRDYWLLRTFGTLWLFGRGIVNQIMKNHPNSELAMTARRHQSIFCAGSDLLQVVSNLLDQHLDNMVTITCEF